MGNRRGARTARQNELGQPGQVGVVAGEVFIEPGQLRLIDILKSRDSQFATEVEQIVLDRDQVFAHRIGKRLCQ